ncbi:hypothetical protein RvY_18860-3 [Ramazzottius varieornatus]|uniref:Uncharacterized protein n=1 Tax=Ramazzottius varieornatus TaxID=947166 RepID=A0A1D1W8P4_RAMVA|nr:hypothetical protein RvY_18860-3 [Ramazzottius varieornatus]
MELPHNGQHHQQDNPDFDGRPAVRRSTSSVSYMSMGEKGDGAYRKPIAVVENLVPAPDELPTVVAPAPDYYDQAETGTTGKYCFLCCACCPQKAHACGSHWRTWFRYTFYFVYVLCVLGAIPAIVVVYKQEENNLRTRLWLIGGLFLFLSIPISLQLILLHLINYTQPQLQRHIVRILWMPPIYAMDSVKNTALLVSGSR